MDNLIAKKITEEVFDLIKKAESIEDVESVLDNLTQPIHSKYRIDSQSYPQIRFSITSDEIDQLVANNMIDGDYNFIGNISGHIKDPLLKLLYATAWKNGDLKKVRHIIKGVVDHQLDEISQDSGIVFYQFGKHLSKTPGQPIIDQHVLRAFSVYQCDDEQKLNAFRKLEIVGKKHKPIIASYKNWLLSDALTDCLRNCKDYVYHIDKVLFATGKHIKL